MSMKPGATTWQCASIVRSREAVARVPIAAMRPSRMPTSPEYHGDPVPSTMWPLLMTVSKVAAVASDDNVSPTGIRIELARHKVVSFMRTPDGGAHASRRSRGVQGPGPVGARVGLILHSDGESADPWRFRHNV